MLRIRYIWKYFIRATILFCIVLAPLKANAIPTLHLYEPANGGTVYLSDLDYIYILIDSGENPLDTSSVSDLAPEFRVTLGGMDFLVGAIPTLYGPGSQPSESIWRYLPIITPSVGEVTVTFFGGAVSDTHGFLNLPSTESFFFVDRSTAVPEPETFVLLVLGIAGLGMTRLITAPHDPAATG